MITSWTIFLVITISIAVVFMILLFFLFRRFKMKTSTNVIVTLIVGLIVGGGAIGFITSTQGTHFIVVKEDLTTETLYCFGTGKYKRASGEEVTITKMNNVLINDSGKELSFEEVVYGYAKEPTFDIIEKDAVFPIKCLPASIYFFENEPPASVEIKPGQTISKFWVNVFEDEGYIDENYDTEDEYYEEEEYIDESEEG